MTSNEYRVLPPLLSQDAHLITGHISSSPRRAVVRNPGSVIKMNLFDAGRSLLVLFPFTMTRCRANFLLSRSWSFYNCKMLTRSPDKTYERV